MVHPPFNLRTCIALAMLLAFSWGTGHAQVLQVTANQNATQLVSNLIGPGINVSNVTLNCPNGGCGTFNGAGTNLGLNSGVVLTSGQVGNAPGPNNQGGAGTDNFAPGDADLNLITNPNQTFDACVLEFDINAICDTIQIAYVFGSEEYDEYVCATFNDVFAFYISGPGIPGTQNIALIPGTTTPVAINTVNNGTVGAFGTNGPGCNLANAAYYTGNAGGASVQYDGFTTSLIAKSWVMPCSTYHIKLAIADAGDGVFDSGVFLEEGGIRCASGIISVQASLNNPTAANAVEGCVDGVFEFVRIGDTTQAANVYFSVGGTATAGADYPPLPAFVTFPPNSSSVSLQVSAFSDGIPEGTESILIIVDDTVCGTVISDTAQIFIVDPPEAEAGPNHTMCLGDSVGLGIPPVNGFSYTWIPTVNLSNPNISEPTFYGNNPGTTIYYVTMQDTNGCISTDSVLLTVEPLPTSPYTFPATLCVGDQGTIQFNGNAPPGSVFNWVFTGANVLSGSGPGPYQVQWTTPGLYDISLEVVAGNCRSAIDTQQVYVGSIPQLTLNPQNVSCNSYLDGSVATTLVNGTPQFNYIWSTGATTTGINGVGPGTYSVTITDSIGCSDVQSVQISEPSPLQNSFQVSPIACFGDNNGAITAQPSGGTGTYSYFWSNGGTTSSITGLGAGTYFVTITDQTGGVQPCQLVDSYVLTEPTELTLVIGSTLSSCDQDNGTAYVFANGGTPPYAYGWNTGGTTTLIQNLSPGTYTVTVQDANGCIANASVVVDETPRPSVTAGPDVSFCEGEGGAQIFATPSGGTPGYYFTWWCNGVCGLDSLNDNDPIANPTQSGWYYVQVTDTNGCVSDVDSLWVQVIPKPIVDAGPDIILCGDNAPCEILSPTISNGSGLYSYQWSPATGLNDPTILNPCARPDTTTIYTLVVTDLATGCTSDYNTLDTMSTVTVHVNPIPTAEAGPDRDICAGETIQLQGFGTDAGPNYQFEWSPVNGLSDPTVPNPFASPSLTTIYSLVVYSNGCPSYADSVTVNVHTLPTVDAGPDRDICQGDSALLDGQASGDTTALGYDFVWSPVDYLSNPMAEDPKAAPPTTTMYYLNATSSWGCEGPVDSMLVTVVSTAIADAGDNPTICLGNSLELQGSHTFDGTTPADPNDVWYAWWPAATLSDSTVPNPVATPTETQWYYLSVTVGNCTTYDSVLVTVVPQIAVSVSADTTVTCEGDSVTLTASGGLGNAGFQWLPTTGLSNPYQAVTMAAPGTTTTYTVVAYEGSCRDTNGITIEVIPAPEPAIISSFPQGCAPHEVSFLHAGDNAVNYIWDFGDGSPVNNEPQTEHTYDAPGSYTVSLTTVNAGGCDATVSDLVIEVGEQPIAEFTSDPSFPIEMSLPNTQVEFMDASKGAVTHAWDFGDGFTSTEINPVHSYLQAGIYMVQLTVENALGCVDKVEHGPYVILTPELFIPNVFSPNGDGINDGFEINYTGSQPYFVQIFDRWGVLLFESRNKNASWTGKNMDGSDVLEGVYYYTLRIGDREFSGNVTLMR